MKHIIKLLSSPIFLRSPYARNFKHIGEIRALVDANTLHLCSPISFLLSSMVAERLFRHLYLPPPTFVFCIHAFAFCAHVSTFCDRHGYCFCVHRFGRFYVILLSVIATEIISARCVHHFARFYVLCSQLNHFCGLRSQVAPF